MKDKHKKISWRFLNINSCCLFDVELPCKQYLKGNIRAHCQIKCTFLEQRTRTQWHNEWLVLQTNCSEQPPRSPLADGTRYDCSQIEWFEAGCIYNYGSHIRRFTRVLKLISSVHISTFVCSSSLQPTLQLWREDSLGKQ